MTAPVQQVGPQSGSQAIDPIAEAGQWKEGLQAQFGATRVDGVVKPNLVAQAAYQSMVAPTASGVALGDLPPHDATAILEARRIAMTAEMVRSYGANMDREAVEVLTEGLPDDAANEILRSWAENIRKNAKLDKEAHKRAMLMARMLKSARDRSFTRAQESVTGNTATTMSHNTTNRQPVANRAPGVRANTGRPMVANVAGGPGAMGALSSPTGGNLGINTGGRKRFG